MLGGRERRQTVCLSPWIYNEREWDARQLQAITVARPTVRAPDCLCELYFIILTTFRCVSAFFPLVFLPLPSSVSIHLWACGCRAADVNTHLPAGRTN